MITPGNADGVRMLLRSTRPMTLRDMTILRGGALIGGTAIPLSVIVLPDRAGAPVPIAPVPEYPTQIISPTYRPRPGWSRVDVALRTIDRLDRAYVRDRSASWRWGVIDGLVLSLLAWLVVVLVVEMMR